MLIRLISARKADNHERANTVKFKLDIKNPPKLTATQRKRLATLAAIPNSKIDYSDIPRQSGDVNWTHPGALISRGG